MRPSFPLVLEPAPNCVAPRCAHRWRSSATRSQSTTESREVPPLMKSQRAIWRDIVAEAFDGSSVAPIERSTFPQVAQDALQNASCRPGRTRLRHANLFAVPRRTRTPFPSLPRARHGYSEPWSPTRSGVGGPTVAIAAANLGTRSSVWCRSRHHRYRLCWTQCKPVTSQPPEHLRESGHRYANQAHE